ncbi:MAG: enoyl-CoA hydratase/isomerase family protein [Clostridiales bacterium]|jgi:enoyl-CoA hydratase/carnithine racemase|nr:enoyl-CoA hydratase/isomerase family protein [Clostridiales bacterium]
MENDFYDEMTVYPGGEKGAEINIRPDGVAFVKMTYKKTNPLDTDFMTSLYDRLTSLINNEKVKAIALSSGLRFAFCSGLDLPGALRFTETDLISKFLGEQYECFFTLLDLVVRSPKPIIAAINGITIGVGVQLAIACDYQVCSELAWFQIPEMVIGGVFPVALLMSRIGKKNTQDMLFQNKKVTADDARSMGLIDIVAAHNDVEREALNLAAGLARIDGFCLELQRRLIREQTAALLANENEKLRPYLEQASRRESLANNLRSLKDANR